VLDVLAEHCVNADYFLVGRMARGYPDLTRRTLAEGHTVGTHSDNHLLGFDRAPMDTVKSEIEQGIASVGAVLGKATAAHEFFRIPGFLRRQEVEANLQSRRLMTWSADVVADDWKHINAFEVVRRTIARLDEKGKGIVLLHDIQPATALALPELLRQLKAKDYRIVLLEPGKGPAPTCAQRRGREAGCPGAQARDVDFGRRQSGARRRRPARSGAAVYLGIETGPQHADAGQVDHHRTGRLAAGHQRAGAESGWCRRIVGHSPESNR